MKLKDLVEQYGDYEVTETKGDWCDAGHVTLELNKPNPKTVWDLQDGDQCIYIDAFGKITSGCLWNEVPQDERAREVGNIFLTKKEAEQDIERRKVETLLLKHGGRRWFKSGKENWFISRSDGLFKSLYTIREQRMGVIYFDTEEQLKKAFKEIGEEKIQKALFEVR